MQTLVWKGREEFSHREVVLWEMRRTLTNSLSLGLKELGSWRLCKIQGTHRVNLGPRWERNTELGRGAPFSQLLTGLHGALALRVPMWVPGEVDEPSRTSLGVLGHRLWSGFCLGGWERRNSADLFWSMGDTPGVSLTYWRRFWGEAAVLWEQMWAHSHTHCTSMLT